MNQNNEVETNDALDDLLDLLEAQLDYSEETGCSWEDRNE